MKLLLLLLLFANVAYHSAVRGWLGPDIHRLAVPEQREPNRAIQQTTPEKIQVLDPATVAAAAFAARLPSCVEAGPLPFEDAERLVSRLAGLGATGQIIPPPEAVNYMVHLPPFATRAEADNAAAQLRVRGVVDLQVLAEPPLFRNAVSLGVFRTEDAAAISAAQLRVKGVNDVRVARRIAPSARSLVEVRELPSDAGARLDEVLREFGTARSGRACAPTR